MRRCCTFGGNVEVLCTGTAIIYGLAMAAAVLLTVLAVKKRMTDGKENAVLGAVWSDYKIAVVCIAWVVGIRIATMLIAHAAFGSGDVIESMPCLLYTSSWMLSLRLLSAAHRCPVVKALSAVRLSVLF